MTDQLQYKCHDCGAENREQDMIAADLDANIDGWLAIYECPCGSEDVAIIEPCPVCDVVTELMDDGEACPACAAEALLDEVRADQLIDERRDERR